MKFAVAVLSLSVLTAGCLNSPIAPSRSMQAVVGGNVEAPVTAGVPAKRQRADVLSTADNTVLGSTQLTRNTNGITVTVSTTALIPGDVYTLWWVIVQPTSLIITHASGVVVDAQGRAHFGAHLSVGPVPPADGSITLVDGVFDSPFLSEVVLVVHHHGPRVPGIVGGMLGTFDVGCINSCEDDPQYAVFLP